MASFIVLDPPGTVGKDEDAVFVRDGFSFLGFFLPLVCLLWHRLWLAGIALLILMIGAAALEPLTNIPVLSLIVNVMAALYVGLEGGRMRTTTLVRDGWHPVAIVSARSLSDAEYLYFDHPQTDKSDVSSGGFTSQRHAQQIGYRRSIGPALGLIDPYGDR